MVAFADLAMLHAAELRAFLLRRFQRVVGALGLVAVVHRVTPFD
jgi:hypothetical protein